MKMSESLKLVKELYETNKKSSEQIKIFKNKTGKRRHTFYRYRKKLGIFKKDTLKPLKMSESLKLVKELYETDKKSFEQIKIFKEKTGKRRHTFYRYRKKLGIFKKDTLKPIVYKDNKIKIRCKYCNKEFIKRKVNMVYCSKKCRLSGGKKYGYFKLRFEVFKRDNFTCQYCGRNVKEDGIKLHCDHIIPKDKGGKDLPKNLTTSCEECNLGKGDVLLNEKELVKY